MALTMALAAALTWPFPLPLLPTCTMSFGLVSCG